MSSNFQANDYFDDDYQDQPDLTLNSLHEASGINFSRHVFRGSATYCLSCTITQFRAIKTSKSIEKSLDQYLV